MTRAPRLALMVPLLGLAALGCSTVPAGRTSFANRWRTMASSGGAALPTESGPPGATVSAELGTPEIPARATGRISGRVIDSQGQPVPNAEVRLADGGARVGRALRATTDDAGGFTLRGLRAGTSYTLIAEGEVGRDALVGRASARAPNVDVRIRLRSETGEPATAEAEGNDEQERRVGRVSARVPIEDQDEAGAPSSNDPSPAPSRSRRVNDADLPPAEDAASLDPFAAERTANANAVPERATRPGWHREKSDAGGEASKVESLERSRPKEKEPIPPKDSPEDERNPLPPAKERTENPLFAPRSEPAPSPFAEPPKSDSPAIQQPAEQTPPDVIPSPDGPPSSLPEGSAAIPAEAPPKQRATWGDITASPTPGAIASAAAIPLSKRRVRANDPDPAASPSPGRLSFLGLKGKKPEAPPAVAATVASCRYDAKNQRIIDFQLPDLDGKATRFQDLDADYVLIDFWGTWCKPCIGSIPHLVDLQKQYGSKTLRVIGVATEHDATPTQQAQRVDQVARSLGVNYPLLLSEADGRPCPLQEALHIQAYPTMILLDRTGRILWRGTGAEEITLARLDRVIAARADSSVLRR